MRAGAWVSILWNAACFVGWVSQSGSKTHLYRMKLKESEKQRLFWKRAHRIDCKIKVHLNSGWLLLNSHLIVFRDDDADMMTTMLNSSNVSNNNNTTISRQQVECDRVEFNASTINYIMEERICYLYIMLPIALVGFMLNIVTIKIFNEKSFNTVAFKYLRFMTCVDLLICFLLGAYSLLCHTTAYNSVDQYVRHIYLVFVYIPFANIGTNLTMLLTVLVTIERLVAIKWPTRKHKLFNTLRYYMSCAWVLIIAIVFNIVYFFLYRIECTSTSIEPVANSFTLWTSWIVYGYIKEVLMRVVPITFLVIANIDLILTVKYVWLSYFSSTILRAREKRVYYHYTWQVLKILCS